MASLTMSIRSESSGLSRRKSGKLCGGGGVQRLIHLRASILRDALNFMEGPQGASSMHPS